VYREPAEATAEMIGTMRSSVNDVTAWIERHVRRLDSERVPLADVAGRIAAAPIVAVVRVPSADRAAVDGVALRADETIGASGYNPLELRLVRHGAPPTRRSAVIIAAGETLPAGTDAVAALDQVQIGFDGRCEIAEPVGAGNLVERAGTHVEAGASLVGSGQRLDAYAIGALAASGVDVLRVIRRPRVGLVLTGRSLAERGQTPAPGSVYDADGALLEALIARDGGQADPPRRTAGDRAALAAALVDDGADIVLVVGGTGPGADDASAATLASVGELAIHGVAVRQCETAGVGIVPPATPVFLLPGAPAACLWAYELFAGAAVRRAGGSPIELPFRTRRMALDRKLASAIGMVDICPVVCRAEGRIEPIAPFAEAGLAAALHADGIVIVPEGSEGYARDSEVLVYLLKG
jgi:molybdopterin molybdotransferase